MNGSLAQLLIDKLQKARFRLFLRVFPNTGLTAVRAVDDKFIDLDHIIDRPIKIARVPKPAAVRGLQHHLDGAKHVAAWQQGQIPAVTRNGAAMRDGNNILSVFEVGVKLRDQKAASGLTHVEILKTLAPVEIVHVVVMHMRLHTTGSIALETITDNMVAQ